MCPGGGVKTPISVPRTAAASSPVLLWALAAVFLFHAFLFAGVVIDDAYISFRFAKNVAAGLGFVYNVGQPVEGYSNFLWVVVAALGQRLGLDPALAMPLLGLCCGVALVLGVWKVASAEGSGSGRLAALLVAGSSGTAFYAATGLETAAFSLTLFLGGLALTRSAAIPFVGWTTLAFLLRPEAGLLGLVGVIAWARRDRGLALRAALGFVFLVGPYLVWKWRTFGGVLPNTLAAKPPDLASGLSYVCWGALPLAAPLWAAARGPHRTLFGLWVLFAVAVIGVGGDWMPADRMLVPLLPWLAVAADGSLEAQLFGGGSGRRRWLWVLGLVGYFGAQGWSSYGQVKSYEDYHELDAVVAQFARQLQARGVRRVALLDIGFFGYVASDIEILDLGGLVDPTIAAAAGGHTAKAPPVDYLRARRPERLLIGSPAAVRRDATGRMQIKAMFPIERALLETSWFLGGYQYLRSVRCHRDYYWHVFAPSQTQ